MIDEPQSETNDVEAHSAGPVSSYKVGQDQSGESSELLNGGTVIDPDLPLKARILANEFAADFDATLETLSNWAGFLEERMAMAGAIARQVSAVKGAWGRKNLPTASLEELQFLMGELEETARLVSEIRASMEQVDRFLDLLDKVSTINLVHPFADDLYDRFFAADLL